MHFVVPNECWMLHKRCMHHRFNLISQDKQILKYNCTWVEILVDKMHSKYIYRRGGSVDRALACGRLRFYPRSLLTSVVKTSSDKSIAKRSMYVTLILQIWFWISHITLPKNQNIEHFLSDICLAKTSWFFTKLNAQNKWCYNIWRQHHWSEDL